jgi:hypothetical protein
MRGNEYVSIDNNSASDVSWTPCNLKHICGLMNYLIPKIGEAMLNITTLSV